MATLVGTQPIFIDALKQLLELEYNSLELYEAVINRLQDERHVTMISNFKKDHEEHVKNIIKLLKEDNAEFTRGPDGTQVLAIAKVALNKMTGGDDLDILNVMLPAEEDNIIAYRRMLEYSDLPHSAVKAFERGLADEKKHIDYISRAMI